METKDWKTIKDEVYGKKGTLRRDALEREFEPFRVSLLLKKAREGGVPQRSNRPDIWL